MSAAPATRPARTGAGIPRLLADRRRTPLPPLRNRGAFLDAVERSGLAGRGGAGFPTAAKLRAVAGRRRPIVVANGAEGEPASSKDAVLMAHDPHLVLDGALIAADAVGAREIIVAVARSAVPARTRLTAALRELRGPARRRITIAAVPDGFVAGEETALVNRLDGGPGRPTFTPPRPFERGVRGRPTLVQNVETLANLALLARHGLDWFRGVGTVEEPGSVLVTVSGCAVAPGVVEVALGTSIREVVDRCGGLSERAGAVLVGGYFGRWIPAGAAAELPLCNAGLRRVGATMGARALVVLPESVCGVVETARIARYLAGESAGQCGPCVFGLDAVASALESIAGGDRGAAHARRRLERYCDQIEGRGACAHPDGAVRLVRSALSTFAGEIDAHLRGRCTATSAVRVLPGLLP
jgi:NADH:ubiquinone oxidoreductase subunit F (NADH-binding)